MALDSSVTSPELWFRVASNVFTAAVFLKTVSHYERRIRDLESDVSAAQEERRKATDELSVIQSQFHEEYMVSESHQTVTRLRSELQRRDVTIEEIRRSMVDIEEEKENVAEEMEALLTKVQSLETALKKRSNEALAADEHRHRLETMIQHLRGDHDLQSSYDNVDAVPVNGYDRTSQLETELAATRQRLAIAEDHVQQLSKRMQYAQSTGRDSQFIISEETTERRDSAQQLRNELHQLEEKHREALHTVQHRADVIKQLREEGRSTEAKLADMQTTLAVTEDRLAESLRKLEIQETLIVKLKTQTEELKQTNSDKDNRLQETMETMKRLAGDTESLTQQANQYGGNVDKLQSHLVQMTSALEARQTLIRQLEARLYESGENLTARDHQVHVLESELSDVWERCRQAEDERGRLVTRLNTLALETKSQGELQTQEIRMREETISLLRNQYAQLMETKSRVEDRANERERALMQAKNELDAAVMTLTVTKKDLAKCQEDLSEKETSSKKAKSSVKRLEERVATLEKQLSDERRLGDETKRSAQETNGDRYRLDQECNQMKLQSQQLIEKVTQRDELLQKLSVETMKLKTKYEEKVSEVQHQTETIHRLQDALANGHADIKDVKRQMDEEIHMKDKSIKQLQMELLQAQNQYSDCYEELNQLEQTLERIKSEKGEMQSQWSQSHSESHHLRSSLEHLELELSLMQEKYRTAKEEIASRDQAVMQARAELDAVRQESSDTLDEMESRSCEISHLRGRVAELEGELRGVRGHVETVEDRAQEKESNLYMLKTEYQQSLEETRHHLMTIDQLQRELHHIRSTHQEEVDSWEQDVQCLREEVDETRCQLKKTREQVGTYQTSEATLHNQVDQLQKELSSTKTEVAWSKERLQQRESETVRQTSDLQSLEGQLEDKKEEIKRLEIELSSKQLQQSTLTEQVTSLHITIEQLKTSLSENEGREEELRGALEKSNQKRHHLGKQLEERNKQISKCEDVIKELTNDLTETQASLQSELARADTVEENLREKMCMLERADEALRAVECDFTDYRGEHSTHDREVESLRLQLEQLTIHMDNLQQSALVKSEHYQSLESTLGELQGHMAALEGERDNAHREAGRLEAELDRLRTEFESTNQSWEEEFTRSEEERNRLEAQLDEMHHSMEDAVNRKIHELESRSSEMKAQLSAMELSRTQLIEELSRRQEECVRTGKELSEMSGEYRKVSGEVNKLETRLEESERALKNAQDRVTLREEELSRLESLTTRQEAECGRLTERCKVVEQDLNESKAEVDRLKAELVKVNGATSQYQSRTETLQTQPGQGADLECQREQCRLLTNQLSQQEITITQLQSELVNLRSHQSDVSKLSTDNKRIVIELQDENESLLKERSQLERQVSDLTRRLQDSQNLTQVRARESDGGRRSGPWGGDVFQRRPESAPFSIGRDEDPRWMRDEIGRLRMALEEARENNDRLQRESEMVVSSMNSWVKEQKTANEKLGEKIREQSNAILNLQQDKDRLEEELNRVRKELSVSRAEIGSQSVTTDKYRALQTHAAQQQALLAQLRTKLDQIEADHDKALQKKTTSIEDLTSRLKSNVDTVARINQQLRGLEKENRRLKAAFEHAELTAQSYRVQADSRDATITSLKAQLEAKAFQALLAEKKSVATDDPEPASTKQYHSIVETAMSEAGVSDPQALDKAYWIQRVGELSQQLQHQSEHWSQQLKLLSEELDRSHAIRSPPPASPHSAQLSPGDSRPVSTSPRPS